MRFKRRSIGVFARCAGLVALILFFAPNCSWAQRDTTIATDSISADSLTKAIIKGFFTEDINSGRGIPPEAEGYVRRGEKYFAQGPEKYEKAIEQFILALRINPNSAYLNFKIGECYLLGNKDKIKSIPYLEKAFHQNKRIDDRIHFLLGRSMQLNMDLESAIKEYEAFIEAYTKKNRITEDMPPDSILLDTRRKIGECKVAKDLMKNPERVFVYNVGENINSKYPDYDPFLTSNDTVLIFTSRRENTKGGGRADIDAEYYEDVYASTKHAEGWEPAQSMSRKFNKKTNNAIVGISGDGLKIFMYRDIEGGNIYLTKMVDGKWSRPKSIKAINTEYHETSACLSNDEKTLYFVSNKPGGLGGHDIYRTELNESGEWGDPVNVGPVINTEYDEGRVFMHRDGKTLYFSSKGHQTMGGYDIFMTTIDSNGTWSTPKNIGYPINTVDDDISFSLSPNKSKGYYSSIKPNGIGSKDIYMVVFLDFLKPEPMSELEAAVVVEPIEVAVWSPEEVSEADSDTVEEQADSSSMVEAKALDNLEFLQDELLAFNPDSADSEDIIKNLETQAVVSNLEKAILEERLKVTTDSLEMNALISQIDLQEQTSLNIEQEIAELREREDSAEAAALLTPESMIMNLNDRVASRQIEIEHLKTLMASADVADRDSIAAVIDSREIKVTLLLEDIAAIKAGSPQPDTMAFTDATPVPSDTVATAVHADVEITVDGYKGIESAESAKLQELNIQASAATAELAALNNELKAAQDPAKRQQIEEEISAKQRTLAAVNAAIEEETALAAGDQAAKSTKLQELNIQASAATAELAALNSELQAAQDPAKRQKIAEEIAAKQRSLEAVNAAIEEETILAAGDQATESTKLKELNIQASIATAELAALNSELQAAQDPIDHQRIESKIMAQKAVVDSLHTAVRQEQENLLAERIALEERDKESKITELKAKAIAKDYLINELDVRLEYTTSPDEITRLTSQIAEAGNERTKLNEQINRLESGESLASVIEAPTAKLNGVEEEIENASVISGDPVMEDKIRETMILELKAKLEAQDALVNRQESRLLHVTDPEEIKRLDAQIRNIKSEKEQVHKQLASLQSGKTVAEVLGASVAEHARTVVEKKEEVAEKLLAEEAAKIAAEDAAIEEEKKADELARLTAEEEKSERDVPTEVGLKAGLEADTVSTAASEGKAGTVPVETNEPDSPGATAVESQEDVAMNTKELPLLRREVVMLQSTIEEREAELEQLESLLDQSETPEEIVHLVQTIEDKKKELGRVEQKLSAAVQALEKLGADSLEIASSDHVVGLKQRISTKSEEVERLEEELQRTMTPDKIVEMIIIIDNKKLELSLLEEALRETKKQERVKELSMRANVQSKKIELNMLNEKLSLAATDEEKAVLTQDIEEQETALEKLTEQLADAGYPANTGDSDGDGILDASDPCPDDYGPETNRGCPLRLYLLGQKKDTLDFALQDKDGVYKFDKLKNSSSFLFMLDAFNVEEVKEVQIKYTDEKGVVRYISAGRDESKYFRYQSMPYVLHMINGQHDTLVSSARNNNGVFVYKELDKEKSYLFVLEGKEADNFEEVKIEYADQNGKTNLLTAVKEKGQEFKYQPQESAGLPGKPVVDSLESARVEKVIIAEKAIEDVAEEPLPLFDEEPESSPATELTGGSSYLLNNILFGFDRSNIEETSFPELDRLVALLKEKPEIRAEIAGHTDHKGPAEYNQLLSERRSASVVQYLVEKGISPNRLIVKGYGESRPIAPNTFPDGTDNPEGREKNRRTEIRILE